MMQPEDAAKTRVLPFLVGTVLIGMGHIALGVGLYYARVQRFSPIVYSDNFVFVLPAILAFFGYFTLAWHKVLSTYQFSAKLSLAVFIAIVLVAISFLCSVTVAFNMWGT